MGGGAVGRVGWGAGLGWGGVQVGPLGLGGGGGTDSPYLPLPSM